MIARLDRRVLLNRQGFHGRAYIRTYVEDTSERGLFALDGSKLDHNFEPVMVLEIADCKRAIRLEFDIDTVGGFENSLFKLNTLIEALRELRKAVRAERNHFQTRDQILRLNSVFEGC